MIARMKVQEDGFIYLSAQQKLKKHFRKNPNYDYSYLRMMVAQIDAYGRVTKFIKGKYKCSQSVIVSQHFQKGDYLVLIEVDWIQKTYNAINLSAYSKVQVDFHEEPIHKFNVPELYQQFMTSYLKSNPPDAKSKTYDFDGTQYNIKKIKVDKYGLVGVFFQNLEKSITLNTKF